MRVGAVMSAVALGIGVVGAGCLTRPIVAGNPTTKVNFTTVVHNQAVDKLDLLFMIDNSASMGDKQVLLSLAVPDMINRLIVPNCVDANGNPTGVVYTAMNGCGANGKPEFPPVHDMHIGIVSSSLGGRGGDQCAPDSKNQANMALNAHNDDGAHLIIRWGANEVPTMDAQSSSGGGNFLAWFPPITANMAQGKVPPDVTPLGPNPGSAPGGMAQMGTLIGDFTGMVQGVHEHGCGFESQNEAWYRFLVQPDPFNAIQLKGQTAQLSGVDPVIIQQRADFLRPDSLVAVIVVTDENEEVADPLAIGGQGWVFENSTFPGSPNLAAPEGTIECRDRVDPANPTTTGPYGPNCTSCAFIKNDPNFKTRCPNDGAGTQGYLDTTDDALNVRFWNQKQRFGIFVGYPTSRYVRGLSKSAVPDSAHEHDKSGNYIGDQQANCVNPLFAANLPTNTNMDLCALQRGPRTPDLIYYAAIAGVPHQLLQQDPNNPDSPQKDTLDAADWTKILGGDPEHYDFTGADFHMIESTQPRTANNLPPGVVNSSNCPPGSSADTCDPINGREWNTNKADLQFACVFDLPSPKDCSSSMYTGACDCAAMAPNSQTQLCQQNGGMYSTTQIKGKAYPSVREMIIAHAMGNQGIVSSLCPIHTQPANNDSPPDPVYGYRPAINAIINRLKASLSQQCLPQKLDPDPNNGGQVPCLILVTLAGTGSCTNPTCEMGQGLTVPPQEILNKFCASQEAAWKAGGGANSAAQDPATQNVCALQQLTPMNNPMAFDGAGSCASPTDGSLGWCYVTEPASGSCSQAILFTNNEPPHGSTVNLQCIEQAVTVVGNGSGGSSSSGATMSAGGSNDSGTAAAGD
ncbi:MAG TPA: hypothetical protein VKU41_00240 [Polyangiaceae bacterium]|nr:hypothetical protein [Polyangiaceae bacterium]